MIQELMSIEKLFIDHNLNKKGKSTKKCPKKIFLKKDVIQKAINKKDGCETLHPMPN